MVAWSHLPVEIRFEIVKKLDFRTRFRLRHVSKTDQQIVDSVPLNLPRIVLKVEGDDMAKLEFYLGINRKIMVDFEKNKEGEAKVKVSGESINNPIEKLVKCENSTLLAFTALKNVASHPKTLLDGFDFCPDRVGARTFVKSNKLLEGHQIRTKTFASRGESCLLHLLLYFCSASDLLEIQSINPTDYPVNLFTCTRKFKIQVENVPEEDFYEMKHNYSVFDSPLTVLPARLRKVTGKWEFKENGPNDLIATGMLGPDHQYHRFNSCGIISCTTDQPIQIENTRDCQMRWTCAKHADPFEYWYLQQACEGYANEGNADYENIPAVKSYREIIQPIVNGLDPVMAIMKEVKDMAKETVDMIEEKLAQIPDGSEAKKVERTDELKVEVTEDQKESKMPENPEESEGSQPEFRAILMIFSVVSVLFVFFYMFF